MDKKLRKLLFLPVLCLGMFVKGQEYLGVYPIIQNITPIITNGPSQTVQPVSLNPNTNPNTLPKRGEIKVSATYSNAQYTGGTDANGVSYEGMMFGVRDNNTQKVLSPMSLLTTMSAVGTPVGASYSPTESSISTGLDPATTYSFNQFLSTEVLVTLPTEDRYYYGDVTYTFSKPVSNPIMHVTGLGGFLALDDVFSFLPYSTDMEIVTGGGVTGVTYLSGTEAANWEGTNKRYFDIKNGNTLVNTFEYADYAVLGDIGTSGNYTGTGSVVVNGVGITSITFKLYIQGKEASQQWTSRAGAQRQVFAGDRFNVSFTLPTVCTLSAFTGVPETTYVGISTLDRNVEGWMSENIGGYIALESDTKPFVVTRMADPAAAIASPVEGMVVWDTDDYCLKLYDGTQWKCMSQGCNY